MYFSKKKKGEVLIENVIFIILNLIFLSILILFLVKQGNGVVVMEEIYAKQIALVIDSGKPGMLIKMYMGDAKEISDENGVKFEEIVTKKDNLVKVKLSKNSGKSYSFFNDVNVSIYPDVASTNNYIIKIYRYK